MRERPVYLEFIVLFHCTYFPSLILTYVHAPSQYHFIQLSPVMNRPERFNARTRRSSSTTSSHKRGKQSRQTVTDTNPEVLPRKSTEEKDLNRREQLKNEVTVLLIC